MKKKSGWTLAELVIALIFIIVISVIGISIFNPKVEKSKIFIYAFLKNLTAANSAIITNKGDVVGNFEPDMANYDWYCMQLADTFTTSEFDCEYETDDTLNAKKVNITLPNGITIQGLTNPWRKPTCTGCDYSFKNILVDIDGEKGLNKLWSDRFPLRIFQGGDKSGQIQTINCEQQRMYGSDGTITDLTNDDGLSPYCYGGFNMEKGAVNKNFWQDGEIVTYDVYRPSSTSDEEGSAELVASALSLLDADCGAYGGDGTGFYTKKQCSYYGKRILPQCVTDNMCAQCVSTESTNIYDICPVRDLNDSSLGITNATTCVDAANEFNPQRASCFVVLHKPGMPMPIFLQGIVGQLDM